MMPNIISVYEKVQEISPTPGASGGLREMPENTLGGGDKEGHAYWSTIGIATVIGRWV